MKREEVEKQLAVVNQKLGALDKGQTTAQIKVPSAPSTWWTTQNAMTISTVVLGFAFLVLCLLTYLVVKKPSSDGEMILRMFGTIIIIFGALFLIVAGYSETQMGPVMGLLGTIVGYLLGKAGPKERDQAER